MITLCPTCISDSQIISDYKKIKSLLYVNIKGNTAEVINNMHKKDPRPNFHMEMGYSNLPDSPDRFDALGYDELMRQINEEPLELAPSLDDIRQEDNVLNELGDIPIYRQ